MAVVISNSKKTVQIDYAWIFSVKKEKFIEVKILQLLSSWKRVEASCNLGILFSGNLFAIYRKHSSGVTSAFLTQLANL